MTATKTPQEDTTKETNPKAVKPAKEAKDDKGGGASSKRSAKQGEKKTTS
ncbi:hypothetical protein BH11PSE7_BH11PSE7_06380 [soil metagenome]